MLTTTTAPKVTILAPDGSPAEKSIIEMSPDQATAFRAAEDACEKLRLQYFVRCRRCFEDFNIADGCKGAAESIDKRVVFVCRCSVRKGVGK